MPSGSPTFLEPCIWRSATATVEKTNLNAEHQANDPPAPSGDHDHVVLEAVGVTKIRGQPGSFATFELSVPQLTLRRGEFVAIVGESGCGKSTLLDILALVSKPNACKVFTLHGQNEVINVHEHWINGDETRLADIRRRWFGYVLQTGGLLPFLSVLDNIHLPQRILGKSVNQNRGLSLASQIGIVNELGKKPHQLSGGQRQRAAILRALIHQPPIILADEPTAAVDKTRAMRIVTDFKTLVRESGATVAMVTHDLSLVASVADRFLGFEVEELGNNSVRSKFGAQLS